ncbi:MAG TPA: LLM class flavin-dependent oxidoreductase [Actinomycetota bacterium]|nr:LLM class flavin-dependent oxidoreductase [Actinomycetota bacterium]
MPDYGGPLGVSLRDIGVTADVLRGWADAAEAGGYSGIWVPDVGGHDAVTTLATFAGTTRRVLLGTGVMPVFSRPPLVIAQTAATLDDLSGGRFVLGLGAGARRPTERWFGTRWSDPFARLQAAVAAVRAVAAGQEVDGFTLAFPPVRPRPPVLLAALNPRMLALAGRLADGVLLNWLPLDAVPDAVARVRKAATEAGRDPAEVVVAGYIRACVGDPGELADDLRPQVLTYLQLPAYAAMLRRYGNADVDRVAAAAPEERAGLVSDRTVEELVATGTADQVAGRLEAYRQAGVDLPVLYPLPAGEHPAARVLATLSALAPGRPLPAGFPSPGPS